jgi:putative spermidine/putrescine transport system substrate-binding protein/spermidine/putrescine transport system substrate-binding protein
MTPKTTRHGPTIAWTAGLLTLTLTALPTGALAQDTLRILTWEGLADDAWIEPFEEEHDVEVRRTYVGSNDEYMSALAAGDTQYDTVVIVSSLGRNAIEAGFVEPLDLDRIPNFERIYPEFAGVDFLRGDGEQYGVPTFWDIQPVTINADVVEDCSFDVLFDEQYEGKIAMWDDVSTIGDVAAYMGYEDIWTLSDEELEQVKNRLVEQSRLVRRYWSTGGEVVELFASGEVVATNSWSYITQQLRDEGMNAEQCAPERPTAWLDSHFIVEGTDNRELAHAFVNYMLEPEVLAQVAETSGFGVTVPDVLDHLDAESTPSVMREDDEFRQSIHFWEEIPRRGRYLEIWNEVKAGT